MLWDTVLETPMLILLIYFEWARYYDSLDIYMATVGMSVK